MLCGRLWLDMQMQLARLLRYSDSEVKLDCILRCKWSIVVMAALQTYALLLTSRLDSPVRMKALCVVRSPRLMH